MELLEGETLRDRLGPRESFPPRKGRGKDFRGLPARKTIEIATQVAHGLAAAHDKGHRPPRPEAGEHLHRLRRPREDSRFRSGEADRRPGLERRCDGRRGSYDGSGVAPTQMVTDAGTVMGTVGYMSPEQVRGQQADHRSDIFSLGCVLFEMATGRRAFQRDTPAETMTAILREDAPEAATDSGAVSPALSQVIRHCLEKRPEERFQSARDLAFALTALTGTTSVDERACARRAGSCREAGALDSLGHRRRGAARSGRRVRRRSHVRASTVGGKHRAGRLVPADHRQPGRRDQPDALTRRQDGRVRGRRGWSFRPVLAAGRRTQSRSPDTTHRATTGSRRSRPTATGLRFAPTVKAAASS